MQEGNIDGEHPRVIGGLVQPAHYGTFNYGYWNDINKVEDLTNSVGEDFDKHFGRKYSAVESVNIGADTKIVLVTISSITTTVRGVIREHPEIGLLKIRLFKPFPKKSVLQALQNISDDCKIVNIERNFLGDYEGAIMQEMKRALYGKSYKIYDVYAGLGGKDVSPITIEKIITKIKKNPNEVTWIDI